MLDPVLVARHHGAADLAVEHRLAPVVQLGRHRIKPLDQDPADRGFLAQPDRRADDKDIGRLDLLPQGRPVVAVIAVIGHVGIDAGGHMMA